MEHSHFVPATRNTRILTLDEATKALIHSRATSDFKLKSWMTDFFERIIQATYKAQKTGEGKCTIMDRTFKITPMSERFEGEFYIRPDDEMTGIPCAVFKLASLELAHNDGTSY